MLKIGDFSKIARVTIRSLRHYDQLNLLKPLYVEADSGYRIYSVDQLPRLNRIIFLKELGFSLNEVKELVDDDISVDKMKSMLHNRKKDLENQILASEENLKAVNERLHKIETESQIPEYDIAIKKVDSYTVAAHREVVPHINEMGEYCYNMYSKLYSELDKLNVDQYGKEITYYYNKEYTETNLDMEVSVMIEENHINISKLNNTELTIKHVDTYENVAYLLYDGPYSGMENAIIELLKWVAMNNWEMIGEVREVHLSGPAHQDGVVAERAIIEFQVPVKKFELTLDPHIRWGFII